jgi:hypothetical protein
MGSNPDKGMDVCFSVSMMYCPVYVVVFATGWSLVQGSPAKCFNKMTKPPVWGGHGPYKQCRATDDDICLLILPVF